MLHELGSTWIFGNSTGMLPNIPQGDLFEEFHRRWKSGIIHPVGPDVHINVEDHKSFCEALYQLQKLKNEIDERDIVYSKLFYSFVTCTEQGFSSKLWKVWTQESFQKKEIFSSSWSFYFKGSKRRDLHALNRWSRDNWRKQNYLPCYRKLTLHELLRIDHNAPWLHPKILPSDYFQLFYSQPKRNRRQLLCKIWGGGGGGKLHYGLCENGEWNWGIGN